MEVKEETSMSTDSRVVTMNLGGGQDEVGVTPDLSGQVHHLPCCIKFDGPSQVSHYFKPKPTGTFLLIDFISVSYCFISVFIAC